MARTIQQIQQEIIDNKNSHPALAALNSTSKTAIWLLWTYIVATAIWSLEVIFDIHKNEITTMLQNMRPHTIKWYGLKAKAFQYGHTLPQDSDIYDNSGYTDVQIEATKVVDYVAIVGGSNYLKVKVATDDGTDLAPLDGTQLASFTAYMNRIKDAGVWLQISSSLADSLALHLTIYYDALILDATGARIDGTTNTPVQDCVNAFLKNIEFDGLLILAELVDALQKLEGVKIPHIESAAAKYAALGWIPFDVEYLPNAGYIRVNPSDLTLNFIAHV